MHSTDFTPFVATGLQGNKGRPYGVMAGFIVTFVSFTLFSRQLLSSANIDPQLIQNISSCLLLIFGGILFSEYLSGKFNQFASKLANIGENLSNTFDTKSSDGFWSGLLFGSCIAFLWAPCAGPILAAILVQTIQQKTDSAAVISLFFFGLGVGIPMLFVTIFGRKLLDRLRFLKTNSTRIRKIVAVIIIGSVLLNKFDFWTRLFTLEPSLGVSVKEQPKNSSKIKMDNKINNKPTRKLIKSIDPYPTPDIQEGNEWINSTPLDLKT
jgi:cytochrome c biogenesis protein CcdA